MHRPSLIFILSYFLSACIPQVPKYKVELILSGSPTNIDIAKKALFDRVNKLYRIDENNFVSKKNRLTINLADTAEWNTVKNLLTENGELAFYETYNSMDIMPIIFKAQETLMDASKRVSSLNGL